MDDNPFSTVHISSETFCKDEVVSEIALNGTPYKRYTGFDENINLDGESCHDMDELEFQELLSCHSADYSMMKQVNSQDVQDMEGINVSKDPLNDAVILQDNSMFEHNQQSQEVFQ